MFHKPAHKDTDSPAGQIRNPIPGTAERVKPLRLSALAWALTLLVAVAGCTAIIGAGLNHFF